MSAVDLMTIHREVTFETPPILLHAFEGFVDAGGGVRLALAQLFERPHELLITFNSDELLDYRARRPRMTFSDDHFTSVDMPRIALHRLTDDAGHDLLLLSGPEPDFRWEAFLQAVDAIIARYRVEKLVGLSAIPWPAPHTRPVGVTTHGNTSELLGGQVAALGDVEVPGHVGALLELRGAERDMASIGITAQVPHYLVQFEYPAAAIALLDALQQTVGLRFSSLELEPAAVRANQEVAGQVAGNDEFAAVVHALESQYDSPEHVADAAVTETGELGVVSGDFLAAQFEEFLAGIDPKDSDGDSPGPEVPRA